MTSQKPRPANARRQVTLGDVTYTLVFDSGALFRLEDALKIDSLDELGERLKRIRGRDLPVMMWAALEAQHPDVALETVAEPIRRLPVGRLQMIGQVVAAAFHAAMSTDDQGDAEGREGADPPNGGRSTA